MELLENRGAERATLAACLHSSDVFFDIEPIVSSNTYTDDVNQVVYKSIAHIYNDDAKTKIDTSLLFSVAKTIGHADVVADKDNRKYIKELFDVFVEPSNARRQAATIRKYEVARLIENQLELAQNDIRSIRGDERIDQIIALAENRIFDFTSLLIDGDNPTYTHISDGAQEYYDYLVENPRDLIGISSGYPNYDISLGGGLQRKTVNVVAARTNVGKSMFADNVALHVAGKLNIPVLYLDTEMDTEGHWFRMWANISGIPMDKIKTGKCGKNEWEDNKVRAAIKQINNIPYYYSNVSGRPFEEIVAYIRRWLVKEVGKDDNGQTKDCLIIYDYLKLMSSDSLSGDLKEYQVLGFQMTGLHNFAMKNSVPILSFIQLNKDGITKEGLEGISQSDRISWLASSVSIFKPKDEAEMSSTMVEGNRKLIVVKSRHGQTHGFNEYINMKFEGSLARLVEGKLSTAVTKEKYKDVGKDGSAEFKINDDKETSNESHPFGLPQG